MREKGNKQGISNILPSIPDEEEEAAISVKCNSGMRDQDVLHDRPETTNGQEMVETQTKFRGIYKVAIW